MALAIIEADRFHARVALERPRETGRRILPAGEQYEGARGHVLTLASPLVILLVERSINCAESTAFHARSSDRNRNAPFLGEGLRLDQCGRRAARGTGQQRQSLPFFSG